jgi:2-polyprenyl-3-methyl-5-hydroxy-6-metoxy-1,4-benzoquinol methylase
LELRRHRITHANLNESQRTVMNQMPISLNLPFAICYPLTLMARKLRKRSIPATGQDQQAYFEEQYRSTMSRYQSHMAPLDLAGKVVLDIGCGLGGRALGWLDLHAVRVHNIDINRQELAAGTNALQKHSPHRISQIDYKHPDEMTVEDRGHVAILFDSFEHLVDPAIVLRQAYDWLHPGGQLWIGSIGWYNYMASHCTGSHIPIPWCQLIFSEQAIIKTIRKLLRRQDYIPNVWEQLEGLGRWDHVTTLRDRPGEPLNMLSLRQVRRTLEDSQFKLVDFRVRGFGGNKNKLAKYFAPLARIPILDEVLHSYYTALLVK